MERIQNNIATHWFREADALTLGRRFMRRREGQKILSFGCSIGDELATLKAIFPLAEIHGCDVDAFVLAKARQSVGHFAAVFESSEEEIRQRGPYDLICAFSSLCINPVPPLNAMRERFSFSSFDNIIALLNDNLNVGGVLCIRNSSYLFSETETSRAYTRVRSGGSAQNGFIPVLNSKGSYALSAVNGPCGPVHKREEVAGLEDWDFVDSVFQKRAPHEKTPEVIVHRDQWTRPDLPFEEVATWSRSNLDPFDGPTDGLVEIVQKYRMLRTPVRPESVLIEREIERQSIVSGEMLHISTAGWWV